jgi:flavin reductase
MTGQSAAGDAAASNIVRERFRDGMARMGHAVNIITSNGTYGQLGFTATSVCSLSDSPPSLLVCLNRSSLQNESLKRNGVLCVNVLASTQEHLSGTFSGKGKIAMPERFKQAQWVKGKTGSPVLQGAIVAFDSQIARVVEDTTHTLFIANVVDIVLGELAASLIYLHRRYRYRASRRREIVSLIPYS